MSALNITARRAMFFAAESGAYRYWYTKAVLKIQIKREDLMAFRKSEVGRRLERYIDLFEIGGGWYEVRGGDTNIFAKFGTQTDGLKMWVRAFNEYHLGKVNANQPKVAVEYVKTLTFPTPRQPQPAPQVPAPSPSKLAALVARFAH